MPPSPHMSPLLICHPSFTRHPPLNTSHLPSHIIPSPSCHLLHLMSPLHTSPLPSYVTSSPSCHPSIHHPLPSYVTSSPHITPPYVTPSPHTSPPPPHTSPPPLHSHCPLELLRVCLAALFNQLIGASFPSPQLCLQEWTLGLCGVLLRHQVTLGRLQRTDLRLQFLTLHEKNTVLLRVHYICPWRGVRWESRVAQIEQTQERCENINTIIAHLLSAFLFWPKHDVHICNDIHTVVTESENNSSVARGERMDK